MRRPARPKRSLAAELENLLEAYQWARRKAYRKYGIRLEAAVSLLRLAIFGNGVWLARFRKRTGLPKYTLTRAARFLCGEERGWAHKTQRGRAVYITPTEEGRRFLRQLDRTTTREFFARVRIKARSQQAQEFAAAVWELNRELPRVIEGPLPLRYTTDYRDDI